MCKLKNPEIEKLEKQKESLQRSFRNAYGQTRKDLQHEIDAVKEKILKVKTIPIHPVNFGQYHQGIASMRAF